MSESSGKRKKKGSESSESNPVEKFAEEGEPSKKKVKKSKQDEVLVDLNNSAELFKPIKTKSSVRPTSEFVATFIDSNAAGPSSGVSKKPQKKTKTVKSKKSSAKPNNGDIKKHLTKSEQVFHSIIENECRETGIDPDEMQMALAISESLTYSNEGTSSTTQDNFKVPLSGMKSVSAKLEQFGFKTQRKLTDYEMGLLADQKLKSKRSKFTKVPTLLTKTSNETRRRVASVKFDRILERSLMPEHSSNNENIHYEVSSCLLQDMRAFTATVWEMSSETRPTEDVLINYYVTDLFEPSFVPAGHLLRDWRDIPGRDRSPERTMKVDNVEQRMSVDGVELEFELVANGSCLDIFGDDDNDENIRSDESFCTDQTENNEENAKRDSSKELAADLEVLHATLSQDDDAHEEEAIELNDDDVNPVNSNETIIYSDVENENEKIDYVDLTQAPVSSSVRHNGDSLIANTADIDLTQGSDDDEEALCTSNKDEETFDKLESCWINDVNEYPDVDLTQDNDDETKEITIPIDDSLHTLKRHLEGFVETETREDASMMEEEDVHVQVISSGETNNEIPSQKSNVEEENDHELETNEHQLSQRSSTMDGDDGADVISISDEEINYSSRYCRRDTDESFEDEKNEDDERENDLEFNDFPNDNQFDDPPPPPIEIEDDPMCENNFIDLTQADDCCINDTVSNLLEKSIVLSNEEKLASPSRVSNNFSDSIKEIMMKYGGVVQSSSTPKAFQRCQSESTLKPRKSVHFAIEEQIDENSANSSNESLKENSANNLNLSLHQSLENLHDASSPPPRPHTSAKPTKRQAAVNLMDDRDYLIDTTTPVAEPDFENMTPVELKQALFKFGIRALSTKKAITILRYIYDRIHPKITSNIEVDMDDSRRHMNMTDVITNIGYRDDDDFPFLPEILPDEEFVLPNPSRKKRPTCQIPLHISFYNMVRSSEQTQRFILEYRPVEVDQIYKHFRKFDLTYDKNEIIAFLDRRCITFKTSKEASLAKTHEKKAAAARSKKRKR